MPRCPIWTCWIAELGLLPHNLPIAQVHINASGDNNKNIKTIGSIIHEEKGRKREAINVYIFLMLKFIICGK